MTMGAASLISGPINVQARAINCPLSTHYQLSIKDAFVPTR